MSMEQRLAQKGRDWAFAADERRASLDFDWTPAELTQIYNRQLPERAAPGINQKWKKAAPRLLMLMAPCVAVLAIVWFALRSTMINRGDDDLTGLWVLGALFLVMSVGPILAGWYRFSTSRKLSKKTVAAFVEAGRRQVQFGKNQERRWRFDKVDIDALHHGRRYVLYSAGDELIYLEEAAG